MDEKFLEQYKKIYLQEKIPDPALQKSWDDISRMLPVQDSPARNPFFRYRFLFAGIILLLLVGTAGIAQASHSGELLYPVKILTNNVAAKIFGKPEITIKRQEKNAIVTPTKSPQPSEKEIKEDQRDLKQEGKEMKEEDKLNSPKSKEDDGKQENRVKGASNEDRVKEKPKNDEDEESTKNKSNELKNGNSNREKSHREKNK